MIDTGILAAFLYDIFLWGAALIGGLLVAISIMVVFIQTFLKLRGRLIARSFNSI